MHAVACQLKKDAYFAFYQISGIKLKNYCSRIHYFPIRFPNDNEKLSPFLEEYLSSEILCV